MSLLTFLFMSAIALLAVATVGILIAIVRVARQYAADREREKYYADQWRKIQLAKRQAGK